MAFQLFSGTKAAAKEAKGAARLFVPAPGVGKAFTSGSKLGRDILGTFTSGPFKELFQGQGRSGLGLPQKKKKKPNASR